METETALLPDNPPPSFQQEWERKPARKSHLFPTKFSPPRESHVMYIGDQGHAMRQPRQQGCCHMYRMLVTVCILTTCTVCLFVWITSTAIENRVIARLATRHDLPALLQPQPQNALLGPEPVPVAAAMVAPAVKSDEAEVHRQRRGRKKKKRPKRSGNNRMRDVVHLTIGEGTHFLQADRSTNRSYFVWKRPGARSPSYTRFTLTRARAQDMQSPNDVLGVKIKKNGLYDVYAQAAVHGRNSIVLPFQCAHEIVRIRRGITKVLLRSYITQHGLGLEIHGEVAEDGAWFPLDTSYHHGVFLLLAQDELRVSFPSVCGTNIRWSNQSPEAMYFGVVKR